jgi:ribonuclease BN (tRNA processing enzyme)
MKIRILGAHNVESKSTGCACLLIDDVLAMDAGSLTSKLSFKEQAKLKAVLLTHRHYDHVKDLPALGMNFFLRGKSLELYAMQSVFNDLAPSFKDEVLYPDFAEKPTQKPTYQLNVVTPGWELSVLEYKVLPVTVNHAVPTVGYQITSSGGQKLFYTSDTGPGLTECWRQVSPDLLIIEVTYSNKYHKLSVEVGHLTPSLLKTELEGFRALKGYLPRVVTVHANPMDEKVLAAELAGVAGALKANIQPGREGMRIEL